MKKSLALLLLTILSFLGSSSPILAISNNKFGIHISQTEDLTKAAELVNSNGGDWGYVTIVIQDNDLNFGKWQEFFDRAREKHLIPLVRLATHFNNGSWEKPTIESIREWVNFLDSLNWPTKNRYVIIYNEPNQTKEWGGEVNPKEYAKILDETIDLFKEKNSDFFILNAGLDQAASNSSTTMDEEKFLEEMNFEVPGIFSKLDGWASHSYPNHGFVGKPWENGRRSIQGYEWELQKLKNLGLNKDLDVFITETGWPFSDLKGRLKKDKFYPSSVVSDYIQQAFEQTWLSDNKVIAITPFILNYPAYPFQNFSWLNSNGQPTAQFNRIKELLKIKGEPEQEEGIEIIDLAIPDFLPSNFTFRGKATLMNKGQSIWGEKTFILQALNSTSNIKLTSLTLLEGVLVKPREKFIFDYTIETGDNNSEEEIGWEKLPSKKIKVFKTIPMNNENNSLFNQIYQLLLKIRYGVN